MYNVGEDLIRTSPVIDGSLIRFLFQLDMETKVKH